MQVTVTFRHVRASKALREYAEDKVSRLGRYLVRPVEAHVILSVVKKNHQAEIHLVAKGASLFAAEHTGDLYSAIDLAVDKIERQVKKLRAKRTNHKANKAGVESALRLRVLSADRFDDHGTPEIIRISRIPSKPMSVDEAVMQMDLTNNEFLVFRNAVDGGVSVLYRRRDGNYGLIEPE